MKVFLTLGLILLLFPLYNAYAQTEKIDGSKILESTSAPQESQEIFNSVNFQNSIIKDENLGAAAKEQSPYKNQEEISFGFAAKSDEAQFFMIGTLFSETLAYLGSGDKVSGIERLKAIEKQFISLGVPNSLYNYITKTRNIIESDKYNDDVWRQFITLFQPLFEDYAKSKSDDKLVLFRAGSWLMDMSIAGAAGDKMAVQQPMKLNYFISEMKRMDAPKGVQDNLDKLAQIAQKTELDDNDLKKAIKFIGNIQSILG